MSKAFAQDRIMKMQCGRVRSMSVAYYIGEEVALISWRRTGGNLVDSRWPGILSSGGGWNSAGDWYWYLPSGPGQDTGYMTLKLTRQDARDEGCCWSFASGPVIHPHTIRSHLHRAFHVSPSWHCSTQGLSCMDICAHAAVSPSPRMLIILLLLMMMVMMMMMSCWMFLHLFVHADLYLVGQWEVHVPWWWIRRRVQDSLHYGYLAEAQCGMRLQNRDQTPPWQHDRPARGWLVGLNPAGLVMGEGDWSTGSSLAWVSPA